QNGTAFTYQIAVAQYKSDGTPDTKFNKLSSTPGRITTAYTNGGTPLQGWAQAAAPFDSTHFWVAGGAIDASGNSNLAVAQYDPPLPAAIASPAPVFSGGDLFLLLASDHSASARGQDNWNARNRHSFGLSDAIASNASGPPLAHGGFDFRTDAG